jgi:hypothetical protein
VQIDKRNIAIVSRLSVHGANTAGKLCQEAGNGSSLSPKASKMRKHQYKVGEVSNGSRIIFKDNRWEKRLGFYRTASDARRVVRAIERYERIAWNLQCNEDADIRDAGDRAFVAQQRQNLKLFLKNSVRRG